ncbi:helix-turn-helix domain-containing protein [Caballeronia sp. SEWSISQ10-4 2]|uniref:helix-turn-helix domain-containing protein n=1 Tax=Caballeronia sp. SEWSISQ10-4 2 TaxID=2937438 RepID=UPI0034623052
MSETKDRNLSLLDVGMACGFSDQSHFTRVFSKLLGTSPGGFRRMSGVRETDV